MAAEENKLCLARAFSEETIKVSLGNAGLIFLRQCRINLLIQRLELLLLAKKTHQNLES